MALPLLIVKRIGSKVVVLPSKSLSTTSSVLAGYWNKDWRPADEPPTTEEGRRAAAKKYGLIPEDYETYPNDGTGYGDYPKLPLISAESRDPHALYDYPELRRNHGEVMHKDFDMVGEDRWHYNQRLPAPMWKMLGSFLTAVVGGAVLFYFGEYIRILPTPMMPKQMPNGSRKYYTFELEDGK